MHEQDTAGGTRNDRSFRERRTGKATRARGPDAKDSNGQADDIIMPSLEEKFDALVARIWAMPVVSDQGWADNPEFTIHDLDSCAVILWGNVIEEFLRGYHDILPDGGSPLVPDYFKECLEIVCDEPTQPLTRHIIKEHLRRGRDLTLGQLTERRFPRHSKNFGKECKRLRDTILWPMHHIQMWSVEIVEGKNRNGSQRVVCYKISAGPALRRFHERVYFPLRRKQIIAVAAHLQRES